MSLQLKLPSTKHLAPFVKTLSLDLSQEELCRLPSDIRERKYLYQASHYCAPKDVNVLNSMK